MKSRLVKLTTIALAMTMSLVMPVGAAQTGSLTTSFDVYSPALTVQVPVNADIRINPLYENSSNGVDKFTVASKDLNFINASVDVDADAAIPVNLTVSATISESASDVKTEYNTFTPEDTSTKKRINLQISEANTPGTVAAAIDSSTGSAKTIVFDANKKIDLSTIEAKGAEYDNVTNKAAVTKWGSLLSVDIAKPTTSDATPGKTFSTDATKVTTPCATVAITGNANINADWKASDIKVDIAYTLKACTALNIAQPTVAAATYSEASAADVTITVPDVKESKVIAVALHNDEEGLYGDFFFEDTQENPIKIEYVDNSGDTDAKITIPKENPTLAFLCGEDYSGEAQDLGIALSDGRKVVTTLTCTAKNS